MRTMKQQERCTWAQGSKLKEELPFVPFNRLLLKLSWNPSSASVKTAVDIARVASDTNLLIWNLAA